MRVPTATMKNLVNAVEDAVPESLSGLCYVYPQLELHRSHKVILSPDCRMRSGKVAVICGGGSGHEPFAAGFIGRGMLTASVAGSIFAAPPSVHITHAINCVTENNKAGVVVIVPNYTGDCLNFGIAIEKARQEGLPVAEIIVGEDCSIPESEQSVTGRRGLSGMVFAMKICGALAERGLPLAEITDVAKLALSNMATYAVGLTACAIPGQGLMFELAQDEIECGMGVHGEAGYEKIKLGTSAQVVSLMLSRIRDALSLVSGDSVAVIVNNFGALSQLEQGIVVHDVVTQLKDAGIEPLRVYSGLLMTSLNSAGIHISILRLIESHKTMFIRCLDDSTDAPHWPGCAYSVPLTIERPPIREAYERKIEKFGIEVEWKVQRLIKMCVQNACAAIIAKETHLNDLDRGCGDGDCGSTLKRLAEGILQQFDLFPIAFPCTVLSEIAHIAEDRMGGASGALYCLFFTTAAKELAVADSKQSWPVSWARVFRSGLDCLMKYGKAKPGDRTMIDAMDAACIELEKNAESFSSDIYEKVAAAAWQGCEATKNMKPRAGRASYAKQAIYLQEVDAGAYAAATWITAIAKTIKHADD